MVGARDAREGARRPLISDHGHDSWLPATGWAFWDTLTTPLVELVFFEFELIEVVEVPVLVVTGRPWVEVRTTPEMSATVSAPAAAAAPEHPIRAPKAHLSRDDLGESSEGVETEHAESGPGWQCT